MKLSFKNTLISLGMLFVANTAVAIPNAWTSGFAQGVSEHIISDKAGNELNISCIGSDEDLDRDHSIFFNTRSGQQITSVEFLIDGKAYYPLDMPTSTRNGANSWYDFIEAIAKGKKIVVYSNNQQLAVFTPTVESRKENAPTLQDCSPRF